VQADRVWALEHIEDLAGIAVARDCETRYFKVGWYRIYRLKWTEIGDVACNDDCIVVVAEKSVKLSVVTVQIC
jgi:hypothetical protein